MQPVIPRAVAMQRTSGTSMPNPGSAGRLLRVALIAAAERDFDAVLARDPRNSDAELQKAVAIAYRAQLNRGISLAKDVRLRFEALRAAQASLSPLLRARAQALLDQTQGITP